MHHFKIFQKLATGLVLLLTLASFDGFASTQNLSQKYQVELITKGNSNHNTKIASFQIIKSSPQKTLFVFAFFDFDCFNLTQNYNTNTAYKLQNLAVLLFLNGNNSLFQNLITILHSGHYQQVFRA